MIDGMMKDGELGLGPVQASQINGKILNFVATFIGDEEEG
jgi:hypothetical protein